MEEAERVRRLADWGLHELRKSEELERLRLARSSRGPEHDARALQAARQRAALAVAEADNQMVELNAMTLVAMMSATDALVEHSCPKRTTSSSSGAYATRWTRPPASTPRRSPVWRTRSSTRHGAS
jgi:hypothetical protein